MFRAETQNVDFSKNDTVGKEEQNGANFDFIALSREELSVWKENNGPWFCVQEFDETKLHVCIKNRPNSIVGTLIIYVHTFWHPILTNRLPPTPFYIHIIYTYTVEPPNKGHLGTRASVHYSEVSFNWRVEMY